MLLGSILKRLADNVVFDLVVACERMLELSEPADAGAHLKAFQRQMDEAVGAIPPFEPDPEPSEPEEDVAMLVDELMPPVVNGLGRKRSADSDAVQCVFDSPSSRREKAANGLCLCRPDEKRLRVTPEPSTPRKGGGSATVASLLKVVREARAKHALTNGSSVPG